MQNAMTAQSAPGASFDVPGADVPLSAPGAPPAPYLPALRWWLCSGHRCYKLAKHHNRRARRAGVEGKLKAKHLKRMFRDARGYAICGAVGLLTVDHITPLARGGENTPANVQPLCVACHAAKDTQRGVGCAPFRVNAE